MANFWTNAIFDYLNNNRHKFDEHGNFDSAPDERDFLPFGMVTYPNGGRGRRPKIKQPKYAGKYKLGEGPDDLAKQRMQMYAKDFEDGIRYDEEKCYDSWEFEKGLCYDGYAGRALQACLSNANDRHNRCKKDKHYDNAPVMWTAELMTGQPQGDGDPDRRGQPELSPDSKPENGSDESKRAMSPTETLLVMNPLLLAYLVAKPEAARVLHNSSADMLLY